MVNCYVCDESISLETPTVWHSETKALPVLAHRNCVPHGADWREGEPVTPDPVSKPEHYNWHPSGVECKDIAEAFNYYLGNAIKYIWRADHKGKPIEDLQKARNCIDLELQRRAKQ